MSETSLDATVDKARWVAAGLCLLRILPVNEDSLSLVGTFLVAAMGERLELPPVGFVGDVGALLLGEEALRATQGGLGRTRLDDPRLETAIRRYEDGVLGRLRSDRRLVAAGDAVAKLPSELRARGVGILVHGVLTRAAFDAGVALSPGVVRNACSRAPREAIERGHEILRDDAAMREALATGYEAIVRGAARARDLISEADVFALENLTVLGSLQQRLAIAQVVDAKELLASRMPARIKSKRKASGATPTTLEDESTYPVGGFSSIATSGSIENLVTSELIYMETRSTDPAAPKPPFDLFDVRYAEGELLYYTRDEAIFVRERRLVAFLLDEDLVATRVKDAASTWQRVVLLLGALVASTEKMMADLGTVDLRFQVVFVRDEGKTSSLESERELLHLALREWRDRGILEISEATLDETAASLAEASRGALVEVVVCSASGDDAREKAWLESARQTKLEGRSITVPFSTGLAGAASIEEWSRGVLELLEKLV